MKRKLLFVDKSFALGGIQTSMLNMINELSKEYDIDLYLYHSEGTLKNRLSNNVKLLQSTWAISAMGMSMKECLQKGSFRQKIFRLLAVIWSKLFDNTIPIQVAFSTQKKLIGYDVAIAYHHEGRKNSVNSGIVRFVSNCTDANIKLAWIHYDPDSVKMDEKYNDKFYQKMDKIVCCSKTISEKFVKYHSNLAEKVDYCYNFLNFTKIYSLSEQEQEYSYNNKNINLFSACRLTKEKAIPRGVQAVAPVLKKYKNIKWFIAGDGSEKEAIIEIIKKENVEDYIILIGNQSNPYPYIKNADFIMVLSYHEAAPMVYMEAKALATPVFTTMVSSTKEMLKSSSACICQNTAEDIRLRFSELMKNQYKIIEARNTKKINKLDNTESHMKFNDLTTYKEIRFK